MPDIKDQVEKILKTTKVIPLHNHNGTDSLAVHQSDVQGPVIQDIQTYTPSAGGTVTLNLQTSNAHHITMPAGNISILTPTNTQGQCFIVRILQDSVGGRTVTWFTTIKWAGGSAPTLTVTANKADTFGFETTSANNFDGFIVGQNI